MNVVRAVMFLFVAIVVCACSSGSLPATPCVPGSQLACACAGGGHGVQVCSADGSRLGACNECPDGSGGTSSTSSAAASVATSASSSSGAGFCGDDPYKNSGPTNTGYADSQDLIAWGYTPKQSMLVDTVNVPFVVSPSMMPGNGKAWVVNDVNGVPGSAQSPVFHVDIFEGSGTVSPPVMVYGGTKYWFAIDLSAPMPGVNEELPQVQGAPVETYKVFSLATPWMSNGFAGPYPFGVFGACL